MIVGISWIILGIINLYLSKKSKLPINRITGKAMLITGALMLITSIINLFVKSNIIDNIIPLYVIFSALYILYKMKEWMVATEVMDELTKKR